MDHDAQERYIEGILGPHQVGVIVAVFLFGLVTTQVHTYFRSYPDDPRRNKLLVGVVWTLLFAHTTLSAFSLYKRMVIGFGQMAELEQYPEAMCEAFSISGLLGSIVQSFFAYRLRKLSDRWLVAFICWVLSLARLGFIVCISVTACQTHSVREYVDQWKWLVIMALSISALVDVTIAGSLSYCLWRRKTDFLKHTQRVVDRLIVYTIHTGLLTSILSILILVLYVSVQNFAWFAAYLVISGVFANYLLASLNSRNDLRDEMNRKPTFLDCETLPDPERLQHPLRIVSLAENSTELSGSDRLQHAGRKQDVIPRVDIIHVTTNQSERA